MREMQPVKLGVTRQARAAARVATLYAAALRSQAVAAKTMIWIVDRNGHRCEHKENKGNLIPARRHEQGGAGGCPCLLPFPR
jgi:hypothetical protein